MWTAVETYDTPIVVPQLPFPALTASRTEMPRPRSAQELIHWLEMGRGSRFIRVGAALLCILALSLLLAWKQFHGATSESALVQADVGRQLARGEGFTTLVNYPQTAAFLEQRGVRFDPAEPYPELHQAPLYSIAVAGALRLLPQAKRDALFSAAPTPPDGFAGDYFLLGLNVALLWLTAWLTFDLARRLFDARVGWIALLALLVSVGVWEQTVTINGAPLLMLLAVAAFWIWARLEISLDAEPRWTRRWAAALGALCGLLFLSEYSAGALMVVVLGYGGFCLPHRFRWRVIAASTLAFIVVTGPWVIRNVVVSGYPTALAIQNVALKAGDPTAEPAVQRASLSAALPAIELNKLANKALTRIQNSVKLDLWSGGAMWLTAFFVAGWLYTFRSREVNRLRWVFTVALAVLVLFQAMFNSGESERLPTGWLSPLIIVFGAGFFSVLVGSNPVLGQWPRWCIVGLLMVQALPLLRDALEPRRQHFQYPPYFPALFVGMRQELEVRDTMKRFGVMADVPAGVAWYGQQRVWAQPGRLRDFHAIALEQPIGELLLTPRTLDRPFFSELAARPNEPATLSRPTEAFGDWGHVYAGLFTGRIPANFPLSAPQKLAGNLYVLLNPALPPPPGK